MISVVVVDDQRDVREGLKVLLNQTPGFRCDGTFQEAATALAGIRQLRPQVVILELDLPGIPGIELIRKIRQEPGQIDLLVYSRNKEDASVFEALRAGARGFLTKDTFPSQLLQALEDLKEGGAPMSHTIARKVVDYFSNEPGEEWTLSEREQDVFRLLCQGESYKSMAEKLFVSIHTIHYHLKNIYRKLEVSSRHEAVMKAPKNSNY